MPATWLAPYGVPPVRVRRVNPPEDHGFMYQRTVADPDGHIWEPFWMDPAAAAPTE